MFSLLADMSHNESFLSYIISYSACPENELNYRFNAQFHSIIPENAKKDRQKQSLFPPVRNPVCLFAFHP